VFQLLKQPNFDFMSGGSRFLMLSAVLMLVSIVLIPVLGLNLGIEFTGGTEVQIKYATTPDLGEVRSSLSAAGLTGQSVSRIGLPEENEVYIRVSSSDAGATGTDPIALVVGALRHDADASRDLNVVDQATLESILSEADGLAVSGGELAEKILSRRREIALFGSSSDLADIEGVTPELIAFLERETTTGPFAVRSQSYIGPAIGRELTQKAGMAIIGSLIGMLLYIWFRFQFQWGLAAVVALGHDTLLTLGLFAVLGKEMSLPVVAAFLTLVGYSVNDTVVVFDRIRENLKKMPASKLEDVVNKSINQTLSRTIITSGLTLIVVVGLLLFGGTALNPFSFVLTIGVLVGTYSSVFVASPIIVLWQRRFGGTQGATASGPARVRRAKKVRATTSAG
jgi:preprotein translocase subunit SecF